MGCVSSSLLHGEDEFPQLRSSALGHHIVSLTSSTYGLLNLDPPVSPSFSRSVYSVGPSSVIPNASFLTPSKPPAFSPNPICDAEVINSWDLMSGLDTESFRNPPVASCKDQASSFDKENIDPNSHRIGCHLPGQDIAVKQVKESSKMQSVDIFKPVKPAPTRLDTPRYSNVEAPVISKVDVCDNSGKIASAAERVHRLKDLCPPHGEGKLVIYTTTLRGIRKTFEDCNVVRSAMEAFGVAICERDLSMDKGFKEELRTLMTMEGEGGIIQLPKVFVKGKYLGGVEEVLRIVEEGWMGELLHGLPKRKARQPCEGCGGVRFVPCFSCNGSCKLMDELHELDCKARSDFPVRCPDCNENGLVLCPICS